MKLGSLWGQQKASPNRRATEQIFLIKWHLILCRGGKVGQGAGGMFWAESLLALDVDFPPFQPRMAKGILIAESLRNIIATPWCSCCREIDS